MQCPKCDGPFDAVRIKNVECLRCSTCFGLWLDQTDKQELMSAMRKIDCPRCHDAMIQMVDKDQFHIQYEACTTCYGIFFDAGEFRDLKDYTIAERLQKLRATIRTNNPIR
ncbi:MAG: zf-TFIIB domain-containing protein [bacterium]|nr:hypothetical protein [Gammaproteobacteria bacterium]HIL98729.1 hypothetical protein [Pseudomonadales bacterium]